MFLSSHLKFQDTGLGSLLAEHYSLAAELKFPAALLSLAEDDLRTLSAAAPDLMSLQCLELNQLTACLSWMFGCLDAWLKSVAAQLRSPAASLRSMGA